MPKTYILCCPTLARELRQALQEYNNNAEVIFLPDQLHSDPRLLHSYVQDKIDALQDAGRIVLCPSGCGGGTNGLRASHGELIVPRTRDCLDILLSGSGIKDIERPRHGIFVTDSWLAYMQRSSIALPRLEARLGREEAEAYLRRLYKGFEHFYIIDTGVYDTAAVGEALAPLLKVLDGTLTVVKGGCGILRKIARNAFDEDFLIVPEGGALPENFYTVNTDL